MKRRVSQNISFFAAFFLAGLVFASPASAATFIIDQISDNFTVGDFNVSGTDVAAGTGLNYEVLKFNFPGQTPSGTVKDGDPIDQAPNGDVDVGDLWSHLAGNGVTNQTSLVFGFDVNQVTNFVDIDALTIMIGNDTWTLGGDTVRVFEHLQPGSSRGEAFFRIDLGYDFMQAFSASSTQDFFIQATHNLENGGFEEYFNIADRSQNHGGGNPAVPEPSTFLSFGLALSAFAFYRKKSA